jgi:hypothetical protein
LDSWEAEEDVKIDHAGEKLSWRKVSTHVVVGDGVRAAHSGDAASGICGNGRGEHPRGCSNGGMAGTVGAAAVAGGGSGGISAMVEADF